MRALTFARPALALLLLAACSGQSPTRILLEPTGTRLFGRGQQAKFHASPFSKRGEPLPTFACAWSSSDEKVATVKGMHNDVTVTATGPTCVAANVASTAALVLGASAVPWLEENGVEPARAMTLALADAGVAPKAIDYVNLHGTSTQLNDRIETQALKNAFGDHAYSLATSATKSQIGHPQGASGAAGIGAALLALNNGIIAPTINLDEPDPACDLDYTPNAMLTFRDPDNIQLEFFWRAANAARPTGT